MMMTPMMVENTSSVQVRNGSHFHWHPSQQFEWQVDASFHLHLCFAPLRPSHSHRWTWWFTKAQQPWIWLPHCLVLMSGKWTLSSSIPIDRWLLSLYIPHLEHLYIQRAMILSISLLTMHLYIYTITGIHAYINKNTSVVLIYSTLRTHVSYKHRYLLNITYIYILYVKHLVASKGNTPWIPICFLKAKGAHIYINEKAIPPWWVEAPKMNPSPAGYRC